MQKNKHWLILALHFAGWVLFFTLQFFLHNEWRGRFPQGQFPGPPGPSFTTTPPFPYVMFIMSVLMIPLFYFNVYFLFPRFIELKRHAAFLLTQLGIIAVLLSLIRLLQHAFYKDASRHPWMVQPIFVYLLITSIAFCYSLIQNSINNEKLQKERENETLKSELLFLRWQISPHFLFNALNNIVALSRVRSDQMEPMLIRLSTLMRYMLYDSDEKRVSLASESEYLQSYISLQSIRLGKRAHVITSFNTAANDAQLIEPMLLIPFVENAFKHGISDSGAAEIHIEMECSADVLTLLVKNRVYDCEALNQDKTPGIGLVNVRRRLDLLYAHRHTLEIATTNGWYSVTLQVNFH